MSAIEQESTAQQPEIDWARTESEAGTVTVQLGGEAPKGWAKHFDNVLALLAQEGKHGWGELSLTKKGVIKVSDVREGAESDLRHFLESVLLQVNSDLASARERGESEEPRPRAQADAQEQADRRMTDTFRGFAERDSAGA